MTITAGSDVKKFVTQVGVSKVGVMAMPKWGNGPYAGKLGSTSQTVGITAWTKYPQVAADFIMFMHTPERMTLVVQDDRRVPGRRPLQHEADHAAAAEGAVRPREERVAVPRELHPDGVRREGELRASRSSCSAGKIDAKQAAAASEQIAERIRLHESDLIANFATWAKSYK